MKRYCFFITVVLSLSAVANVAHADLIEISSLSGGPESFTVSGRKWEPGPNTAAVLTVPSPGAATFSIVGSGIGLAPFVAAFDSDHTGLTHSLLDLGVPGFTTIGDYAAVIDWALDKWAAVSGFTNLGEVPDSGAEIGGLEFTGAHIGDIRVAALEIVTAIVLAHAITPGTELLDGPGGTIFGDFHFDVDHTWVDNPDDVSGNGEFDIYSVALHELGHALGLGHSTDPSAVMYASYTGAKRTLTADDIAGIQAIYGPAIPEPTGMVLLVIGSVILVVPRLLRRPV